MFHNRVWFIAPMNTPQELADYLTKYSSLVGCAGFEHAGYLYLNDSTSADGAAEYGIVRKSDLVQIESMTFGWFGNDERWREVEHETRDQYWARYHSAKRTEILSEIKRISAHVYDGANYGTIRPEQITYDKSHHCGLCA